MLLNVNPEYLSSYLLLFSLSCYKIIFNYILILTISPMTTADSIMNYVFLCYCFRCIVMNVSSLMLNVQMKIAMSIFREQILMSTLKFVTFVKLLVYIVRCNYHSLTLRYLTADCLIILIHFFSSNMCT